MKDIPVLCVVQARLKSTRLPEKMLQTLDGQTLIERAWRTACSAFGAEHVVVAMPECDKGTALSSHVSAMGAQAYFHPGDERDVLGRFVAVAHLYRWHPDSVICRVTCDDVHKDVVSLQRVAAGERLPVEQGGEAFTLAMLDEADRMTRCIESTEARQKYREHITYALFTSAPPPAPSGRVWTIDTQEQLDAVRAEIAQQHAQHEQRRG